jgi:hypothetical protein
MTEQYNDNRIVDLTSPSDDVAGGFFWVPLAFAFALSFEAALGARCYVSAGDC